MKLLNCIYRFFNINGEVIYIGKAKDLQKRLSNHNHLPKECYDERVEIDFAVFETIDDMDLAERYFIPKYKPKYNVMMKENNLSVDIDKFEKVKWFKYNPHMIIENKAELEELLNLYELNRRIRELQSSIQILKTEEMEIDNSNKIEYMKNDLLRNQKNRLKLVLGVEEFDKLSKEEVDLYIKYNETDKQEILNIISEEIIDKYTDIITDSLQKKGYYNYTEFIENVYGEFKKNPYFPDKAWVDWIDEGQTKLIHKYYSDRMLNFIDWIFRRISDIITFRFGTLKTDAIIDNIPYIYDSNIKIPTAILVKRL